MLISFLLDDLMLDVIAVICHRQAVDLNSNRLVQIDYLFAEDMDSVSLNMPYVSIS